MYRLFCTTRMYRYMLLRFSYIVSILFLIYPNIRIVAKQFQLFDMTGEMPGVVKLGSSYRSKLCATIPERYLDRDQSDGHNIWECLKNTTSTCSSLLTKTIESNAGEHFYSNRRKLLKRTSVRNRKRRERGWLNGHPNQQDYECINRHVLSSRKSCFIISRECIRTGLSSIELYDYETNFPLFETRSWGSCALVGLSDEMLLRQYGKEIDAHDVVIRMGHLPLTRYNKYVGSRSDIVLFRPGALKRDQKEHRPSDVKAYLCKNPSQVRLGHRAITTSSKTSFNSLKNARSIYCDKSQGKNDFAHLLLSQLYKNMAPNKKPTTGTLYAIRLAFSRLCGRLDIYGISSGGGGTYFEPEAITKSKHGTELDSWLLHYLMKNFEEELRTCIYT